MFLYISHDAWLLGRLCHCWAATFKKAFHGSCLEHCDLCQGSDIMWQVMNCLQKQWLRSQRGVGALVQIPYKQQLRG